MIWATHKERGAGEGKSTVELVLRQSYTMNASVERVRHVVLDCVQKALDIKGDFFDTTL
jgi:hypothetical protein